LPKDRDEELLVFMPLTYMRVQRCNTGETVSREVVAASGRGCVGSVGGDHIVDGRLVNSIVGDTNDSCEDDWCNPVGFVRCE